MFRFLHSADWQLGARFAQFGAKGAVLRAARLTTLRRVLALAHEHNVDAMIIAGDLFEDNQVDEALVVETVELFGAFPSVPIFILPGNHDPATGPDSVWQRKPFLRAPGHVHVLMQAGITALGAGVHLLASPLHQKLSTVDPSLKLVELAATLPADAIAIGVTHGAPAIEGKHQPNDFPIALNAASRAGLDYLAIGHWHNWLADTDGGRIVMPGTPEPDQFANERCGHVALVEIAGHGQPPRVQPLPVSTLTWKALTLDFLAPEASRASLDAELARLRPAAARTVVRITLAGTASPAQLTAVRATLDEALAPFLVGQIVDRTRVALSPVELDALKVTHPILAQTLADLDRIEALATGATVAAGETTTPALPPLTLAEVQALLTPSKIELAALTPEFFSQLRHMLLQTLQEVAS
ncbi:metallophosphoesterase family protein [Horticoccus sp. 23ND18S-11]|uniref:metallophosphoesterase family protein n=1 Tax=Horticoccus sp. 23ND18S-11 TaxID=3391832 RepID=UPI0039C970F6